MRSTQEQSILSRQETNLQETPFRPGDQLHFHESNLTPYKQIEAMRLVDEAFADIEAETMMEQATVSSETMAHAESNVEVELSPEDRIGRIGLNLAAIRSLSKSDFGLAA